MQSEAKTTILVVEDEEIVRGALVAELEEVGYRTIETSSGESALDVLRERRQEIDWLFTDIRLPGTIDGWRVAEAFRVIHPQRPVVYATGHEIDEAKQLDGSYFFRKPYRPMQIVGAFRRLSLDFDPEERA